MMDIYRLGLLMKQFILLILFTLTLFAQNPKSFAALGDVTYDDIETFKKLKEMPSMKDYEGDIDAYITFALSTKEMGFAVDAKDKSVDSKVYLKALRKLSAEHDAIILNSRKRFKEAMSDEDSETINKMVLCGVINPENYKNELIDYYSEFGEDSNLSSLDAMYQEYLKSIKKDTNTSKLTEAQKEKRENAARIKRIRAKIEAKEAALEKSVAQEQKREKEKVLSKQKKELGIE